MNRRQLLQRAGASLALPAVPAIAVAAPAGATVTSLIDQHRALQRRYEAVQALFDATPGEPEELAAEVDRQCYAVMDLEPLVCAARPRDLREAIMLLRFVRENAIGDPYTHDQLTSHWSDSREFVGIDNVLAFLEGMVQ